MILTEDQQAAENLLKEFLKSDDNFFRLTGSAGTGKTTLLGRLSTYFPPDKILATGPTHKSVAVLAGKISGVQCCTIHRFLGLRPKRSKNGTVLIRRLDYDPSGLVGVRVVVLDEASMPGKDITRFVIDDAETWGRKYIICGDKYQLPPVDESESPLLNMTIGKWDVELRKVVRQAQDNPIIKNSTVIRDAIDRGIQPVIKAGLYDGVGVHFMKKQDWLDKLKEVAVELNPDPDSFRVLVYKNDTSREYNQVVRGMQGKDISVPFSPGEFVFVNEAFQQHDEVILNTGIEPKVLIMQPSEHPNYTNLKGWTVLVKVDEEELAVEVLDHISSGAAYKNLLYTLEENAKVSGDWRVYYGIKEFYCDLRPLYSITVHKSQGSTFDNVFVDYRDIYSNRKQLEADQCLNVAITRPRFNCYVLI